MPNKYNANISGPFHGVSGETIFRLDNGQVWQQRRYQYEYMYAYRPAARVYSSGSSTFIEVQGMSSAVEVVRVSIETEGVIVSEFRGFNSDAQFHFDNGQVWVQAENKYEYEYSHRPEALIISGVNSHTLHVEGMSETVAVRRIR